jgi:hypothetical protein
VTGSRTPEDVLANYRLRIHIQKRPREVKGAYALFQARESYGDWFKIRVAFKRAKRHIDGSVCLEGVRSSIPRGYKVCCEVFERCLFACVYDIRFEWWPKSKIWVIRVADGGSSGLVMNFCPYCGAALPKSGRRFREGRVIEV